MLTNLSPEKLQEYLISVFGKEDIVTDIKKGLETNATRCIFRALRGPKMVCESNFTEPYGFCSKHLKTVTGQNAIKQWETINVQKVTPKDNNYVPLDTSEGSVRSTQEPIEEVDVSDEVEAEQDLTSDVSEDEELPSDSSEAEGSSSGEEVTVPMRIRKNKWGNYEHTDTHIVFDIKSRLAYGIQHKNGDIYSLDSDSIKICTKNGWGYFVPVQRYSKEE